jgi:hypothetical protein
MRISSAGRVLFCGPSVIVLCLIAASCTKTESTQSSPGQSAAITSGKVNIEFKSDYFPLKTGDNGLEVTVNEPGGAPVNDATVTAVFSMPAMPAMNMPAMRSSTTLSPQGGGHYRGSGQLSMAGTWTVSITVMRGSQELGRSTLSVVAK